MAKLLKQQELKKLGTMFKDNFEPSLIKLQLCSLKKRLQESVDSQKNIKGQIKTDVILEQRIGYVIDSYLIWFLQPL